MAFNGAGTYITLTPPDFPAVAGQVILASAYNNQINDMATALSLCVARDGQSTMTGALNMNSHKVTNVTAATLATDAPNYGQVVPLIGGVTMTGPLGITTASTCTFAAPVVFSGGTATFSASTLCSNGLTVNSGLTVASGGATVTNGDVFLTNLVTGPNVWINAGVAGHSGLVFQNNGTVTSAILAYSNALQFTYGPVGYPVAFYMDTSTGIVSHNTPLQVVNTYFKVAGYNGVTTDGVIQFGVPGTSYFQKLGTAWKIYNAESALMATLNAGGTILTDQNRMAPVTCSVGISADVAGATVGFLSFGSTFYDPSACWVIGSPTRVTAPALTTQVRIEGALYATGTATLIVLDVYKNGVLWTSLGRNLLQSLPDIATVFAAGAAAPGDYFELHYSAGTGTMTLKSIKTHLTVQFS